MSQVLFEDGLERDRACSGCGVTVIGFLALFALWLPLLFEPASEKDPGSHAVASLKAISSAQSLFREGDKDQDGVLDYASLAELGSHHLVDGVLASGAKQGYRYEVRSGGTFTWCATATPEDPEVYERSFFTNHEGVIYTRRGGRFDIAEVDSQCGVPRDCVPLGQ